MGKLKILKEYIIFLGNNKKWWLLPIVFMIVLLGALLVLSGSSPLAPFIYTLF